MRKVRVLGNRVAELHTQPTGARVAPVLREARLADASFIHEMLTRYSREGLLMARPLEDIEASVGAFILAEINGEPAGCGSLFVYDPQLAEIRSLAVRPDRQRSGVGRRLVEGLIQQALAQNIPRLFALTFQTQFFLQVGFSPIDKQALPQKIWKDCVGCPHYPICKEEAFVLDLTDRER